MFRIEHLKTETDEIRRTIITRIDEQGFGEAINHKENDAHQEIQIKRKVIMQVYWINETEKKQTKWREMLQVPRNFLDVVRWMKLNSGNKKATPGH